jgi:hypothetical protein
MVRKVRKVRMVLTVLVPVLVPVLVLVLVPQMQNITRFRVPRQLKFCNSALHRCYFGYEFAF